MGSGHRVAPMPLTSGQLFGCLGCVFVAFIVGIACSWDTLEPTEYGLIYNKFTGSVDTSQVYAGGRHFVGIAWAFIRLPSTQQNIEFSTRRGAVEGPVSARTGKENPEDPGGQPVDLSICFQYRLLKEHVGQLYRTFGVNYEVSVRRFAHMEITNVVQDLNPSQFWLDRDIITPLLTHRVNSSLISHSSVELTGFNLLRTDFHPQYEGTIVSMKLQEQYKITNEYQQSVTQILQTIEIQKADYDAQIQGILSRAEAEAKETINLASANGFKHIQTSKANAYSQLQERLRLNHTQLVDYIKIKSINGQRNKTIGVDKFWDK